MSSSVILVNNASSSAVLDGGIVPLGTAIHGSGRSIRLNGNSLNIVDNGYYRIIASCSVDVTAATAESLVLNVNGAAVSGAIATAVPAAAGDSVNLTLVWLIRKSCCCNPAAITFTLSGAGTVTNFTVDIEKL